MKRFLLALALVLGSLVAPLPAFAEEDTSSPEMHIQISPTTNYPTLIPGRTLEYTLTLQNESDTSYGVSIYTAPYTVSGEAYDINFNNETSRTQIARWVKFINDDGSTSTEYNGTVEAGQKKQVKYLISVPEDIPSGGQYATILAEINPSGDGDSTGVKAVPRVGMILYGRTDGDTRDEAEITDYRITTFLTGGHVTASSLIKNSGNTDFDTIQSFDVSTIFGKTLYSTDDQYYSILPDTERRVNYEWDHTPTMGIFKVHYKVEALDTTRDETKLVLIMPIYMIVIMIILLTLFIAWLIIIIRKRRERKSRLLV